MKWFKGFDLFFEYNRINGEKEVGRDSGNRMHVTGIGKEKSVLGTTTLPFFKCRLSNLEKLLCCR